MSDGKETPSWATSKLQQVARMVYVEDQACNLPRIERASVSSPSTSTANPSSAKASSERIVHG